MKWRLVKLPDPYIDGEYGGKYSITHEIQFWEETANYWASVDRGNKDKMTYKFSVLTEAPLQPEVVMETETQTTYADYLAKIEAEHKAREEWNNRVKYEPPKKKGWFW